MKHYKTTYVILISLFLLYGCKETPSGVSIDPNTTELEIKNDLNIDDPPFDGYVLIENKYDCSNSWYSIEKEIDLQYGENVVISFTEEEVSKLTNLDVRIFYNDPIYMDFRLGERRVVRIVCLELKTPTECESGKITYTIED